MDKQTLKVQYTLIALVIADKLSSVFDDVLLVTNKPELYVKTRYRVVEDIYKDAGPLGGIHSGLVHAYGDTAYVTACDMPNVCLPYIAWIKNIMNKEACDILTVKRHNGMVEPFNGFYSKASVSAIEQMLAAHEYKMSAVHSKLAAHYIDEEDIKQFGAYDDLFFNMNWQHQIKNYLARINSQSQKGVKV